MKIVIATIKSWNIEKAERLRKETAGKHEITIITFKEEFTLEVLDKIQPALILLPHWSFMIPEAIFEKYPCVIFHMTDLPYGRGGSPLQNLIVRGKKETMLSAIQVVRTLDAGPVYMKMPLSLEGSATEIFDRCSDIIFDKMIPAFLENIPTPIPQEGEVTIFRRRKPEDGRLLPDMTLETMYDYIRMLDAEGYPHSFMEFGDYRLEFEQAALKNGELEAKVIFKKKEK